MVTAVPCSSRPSPAALLSSYEACVSPSIPRVRVRRLADSHSVSALWRHMEGTFFPRDVTSRLAVICRCGSLLRCFLLSCSLLFVPAVKTLISLIIAYVLSVVSSSPPPFLCSLGLGAILVHFRPPHFFGMFPWFPFPPPAVLLSFSVQSCFRPEAKTASKRFSDFLLRQFHPVLALAFAPKLLFIPPMRSTQQLAHPQRGVASTQARPESGTQTARQSTVS